MKKLSFLAMAAFGLLFAACSSDRDVADNGSDNLYEGQGAGFFKVGLNLPTNVVTSTRAAGEGWGESTSGNLADGDEYEVENVLLLIFDGTSETNAQLVQVIDPSLTFDDVDTDNPNQITKNKEYVANLANEPSDNLYILAVLNHSNIIEMSSSTTISIGGGTAIAKAKLSDLQAALTDKTFYYENGGKKYFFMTNAVLSNKKGGSTDPGASITAQTLVPIKAEYIYKTSTEASSGQTAADIYVERGVAKVTMDATSLGNDDIKVSGSSTAATVAFENWILDNTNKKEFPVRKVPSTFTWNLISHAAETGQKYASTMADKYRFVGGNAVDKVYGTETAYRTYWAEDPNYSSYDAGDFNRIGTDATKVNGALATPQYCLENTFNVANQTSESTTRAIIKVKIGTGDPFLIVGADRKTLYTLTNVKQMIATALFNQSLFKDYIAKLSSTVSGLTDTDLTITWEDASGATWSESTPAAGIIKIKDIVVDGDGGKFTPAISDLTLSSIDDSGAGGTGFKGSDAISTINDALADIEYFVGGMSYYQVRIQHFGDVLTPWNDGEYTTNAPEESTIDKIYPDNSGLQDANYLGRYGVVRNNWYDIQLGKVLRVGSSTPPSLSTHPDDDLEDYYIKARINILSWAKRTQSWNLK